jgi:hypothetical protein
MSARGVVLRLILLLFAATLFVGTGEIALRVIYRDAGKRTLGGPGGRSFEHVTVRDDLRGRFDTGPKTDTPRIMIVGDSITWGQGVREWQDTWPELLARALEGAGTPHEMAVVAMPGRDIPAHVEETERWLPLVKPDVFIYQWYVNDIEVEARRPRNLRSWQQWPGHESLRRSSYLYYFLDNRLSTYSPPTERSYVDYVLQDYAPGTLEWAEFERYFHRLAVDAMQVAPRRLLVIYPQVPFRGAAPLASVYDRVATMAGRHVLTIPPAAWVRYRGTLVERADAPARQIVRVDRATRGTILETRDYLVRGGGIDIVVTAAIDERVSPAPVGSAEWGTLDIIDAASNQVISSTPLAMPARDEGWQEIRVQTTIFPTRAVRWRISANGSAAVSLANVGIPVDYGFSVVNLSDVLNTFNTHTSIFDAHPNEQAHKVVAEKVFAALQNAGRH